MRILSQLLTLLAFNTSFCLRINPLITLFENKIDSACKFITMHSAYPPAPNIDELSFILVTKCKRVSYKFLNITDLVEDPLFVSANTTYMFVPGWLDSGNFSEVGDVLTKAFLCHGDNNFIIVNLNRYLQTLYTWAVSRIMTLGEHLAQSLHILFINYPELLKNFILMGHSLGAQIVGQAARVLKFKESIILPILIGFDPANPCFNNNGNGLASISAFDAEFVMIYHSNIDIFGQHGPDGTVDIYASGENTIQPGCRFLKSIMQLNIVNVFCSHLRCIYYFAESLFEGNEDNFIASKCENMQELGQNNCIGETISVGINSLRNVTGIYYLPVNPSEPYGQSASNQCFRSKNLKCDLCTEK